MKYDFIEIGTSDFDTIIEICGDTEVGASVEPIKSYLDRLPDKHNVRKINAAISSEDAEANVYYISKEDVAKYNLPTWVSGCNSIEKYHPQALEQVLVRGLDPDKIFITEKVKKMSVKSLFDELNVTSLVLLKIDCEGHDLVIVENLLSSYKKNEIILPNKLEFEVNDLTDRSRLEKLIHNLHSCGYKNTYTTKSNTIEFQLGE
jgi:FkbM family methyltransferase